MGVLDRVRARARQVRSGAANAGLDLVKAPSRLIRSVRPDRGGDGSAGKQKPAKAPAAAVPGDGILPRARANPWLIVGIAAGGLLVAGWIAWAAYVTSEHGATAGLGVVIAWPALLISLVLVALPFVGLGLLIRRLRLNGDEPSSGAVEAEEGDAQEEGDSAEEEGDREMAEGSEEAEEVPSG
jgi:hypothetical protein